MHSLSLEREQLIFRSQPLFAYCQPIKNQPDVERIHADWPENFETSQFLVTFRRFWINEMIPVLQFLA